MSVFDNRPAIASAIVAAVAAAIEAVAAGKGDEEALMRLAEVAADRAAKASFREYKP